MEAHKKTKIIATIGPISDSPERIIELIRAGVNIFRFNMKHATIDWHNERIKRVRQASKKIDMPVAVLIDLQGPEIRLETKNQKEVEVNRGDEIFITELPNGKSSVNIPHAEFFEVLGVRDFFSVDNGSLEFIVLSKKKNGIMVQALNDGVIKHRKGVNVPGKNINLPSLISDDLKKLNMVAKNKVDFVALSFSRTKKDIETLKKELNKRDIKARIVAKIESQQALLNIDELIEAADGIMVARGDLGIEIPIEELAYNQKRIVKKCRLAKKPVIIATQMLQSMIRSPHPTRAEATDVSNAVYDGADAVMLSEETSAGKFPLKAVQAMARILRFNEHKVNLTKLNGEARDLKQLIINAAVSIVNDKSKANIGAMIVFTETGYTARVLSSFHPKVPIFALTDRQDTAEALILSYGITPIHAKKLMGITKPTELVIKMLKKEKYIKSGQQVLLVHGESRRSNHPISSISLVNVK